MGLEQKLDSRSEILQALQEKHHEKSSSIAAITIVSPDSLSIASISE
ncbi:MAG: hypothetical protein ACXAC8_13115 [Candidatus Hodarchaeales archaeon]